MNNLTLEELKMVVAILQSAQITGTAESLRVALAVHGSALGKLSAALERMEAGRKELPSERRVEAPATRVEKR